VQADDWLSKLADKFLGDVTGYSKIAEATNKANTTDSSYAKVADVNVIEIGWKLCIPSGSSTTSTTPTATQPITTTAEMTATAETTATHEMTATHEATTTHDAKPHWTYSGEEGPEAWGDLATEYALCKTGKSQSPIDFTYAVTHSGGITMSYQPTHVNMVNNGHTIQVNYDPGSYMELDGVRYDLLQFHFHAPSEHTENGTTATMELHLVHKSAEGNLAVVGLMLDAGADNAVLAKFWDKIPTKPEAITLTDTINIAEALPTASPYYSYSGSLTTPPCSEGVKWTVLDDRGQVSPAQVQSFMTIIGMDARPVQPLNDRVLQ
jgi:carbonic anhydrase